MARIIDLTHDIHPAMPLYPGMEPPAIEKALCIEDCGYEERRLTLFSHTGTHIDAPAHMVPGGATLGELGLESFLGPACVLDVRGRDFIEIKDLEEYAPALGQCAFALLRTGWEEHWGSQEYFQGWPALSVAAGRWLLGLPLRGIGIDAISMDRSDSTNYPVHHEIFARKLIVIENLCNLDKLMDAIFVLSVLPLKIPGLDGSPVRAVGLLV